MTIYDYWLNPLAPVATQVIGYRGELEEFPHDLYSYLLSTIREQDQNDVALIWRWLQPMQQFWESQYAQILAIPYLLSPEDCPEPYLNYLRKQIGIMDDMGYLWSALNEADQRRLIKFFVRFLKYRSTTFGLTEALETMTGQPIYIMNYFDYRWLLSGTLTRDIEGALGREEDGYDSWLLSESDLPVGIMPDTVIVLDVSGVKYYKFKLNYVVSLVERPVPERVYMKYMGTGAGNYTGIYYDGSDWWAVMAADYIFGQPSGSLSTEPSNFRASFESDELVFDVIIEDDGELNRDKVVGVVRFYRPQSERVYIRYYSLYELFVNYDRWETTQGTATWSETNKNVVLDDGGVNTIIQCIADGSDEWSSYCVHAQMRHSVNLKYFQIRFMVQDSDNYYYLKLLAPNPPTIPPGIWQLRRVVGGSDSLLATGDLNWLDADVDYFWRIESITSSRPGGEVQVLRVYQDEDLLVTYDDDPAPWSGNANGTVEIVNEAGGELTVSRVYVHPLPMEFDFVGP